MPLFGHTEQFQRKRTHRPSFRHFRQFGYVRFILQPFRYQIRFGLQLLSAERQSSPFATQRIKARFRFAALGTPMFKLMGQFFSPVTFQKFARLFKPFLSQPGHKKHFILTRFCLQFPAPFLFLGALPELIFVRRSALHKQLMHSLLQLLTFRSERVDLRFTFRQPACKFLPLPFPFHFLHHFIHSLFQERRNRGCIAKINDRRRLLFKRGQLFFQRLLLTHAVFFFIPQLQHFA